MHGLRPERILLAAGLLSGLMPPAFWFWFADSERTARAQSSCSTYYQCPGVRGGSVFAAG